MSETTSNAPLWQTPSWRAAAGWSLLVAVGYFALGRSALLLAIAPGYATAVWPAAGLALFVCLVWGWRILPGVALGSFAVNVALDDPASIPIAASIGVGACLQAAMGAWAVRKVAPALGRMETGREVASVLLVGGALCSAIAALWGGGTLVLAGTTTWVELPINVSTWWVGDAIGVMLMTPILLVVADRSAPRARKIQVTVPLSLTLLVLIALFVATSAREGAELEAQFRERCVPVTRSLEGEIDRISATLGAATGFVRAVGSPTQSQWETFAEPVRRQHPALLSLDWVEAVTRPSSLDGIYETDAQGDLVPAGRRENYAVVRATVPKVIDRGVIGYDLASDPIKRDAIDRAVQSDEPAATQALNLVRDDSDEPSLQVFSAVRRDDRLVGFVVANYRVSSLVRAALRGAEFPPELHVVDADANAEQDSTLYGAKGPAPPAFRHTITVGGRSWRLAYYAKGAVARAWAAWFVLLGGLTLTCLLSAFLLILTGRAARVERLVAERTWEIAKAKEEAETANVALEYARENKNHFLANLSHELRTPLNAIVGFTSLMHDGRVGPPAPGHVEFLSDVLDASRHLARLVDDALDVSRVEAGKLSFEPTEFDVSEALASHLSSIQNQFEERGVALRQELDALWVELDADRLRQVVTNLVSNALKFTPAGGTITVRCADRGDHLQIDVEDTGIGIASEDLDRLFMPFSQLAAGKAKAHGGTGLGLALVRRIVEYQGGVVEVASEVGVGTTFTVRLPLQHSGSTQEWPRIAPGESA